MNPLKFSKIKFYFLIFTINFSLCLCCIILIALNCFRPNVGYQALVDKNRLLLLTLILRFLFVVYMFALLF